MNYHNNLRIEGHLKITELVSGLVVFDHHNMIVDQGKGMLMDYLASKGAPPSYTASPFSAMVLTINGAPERSSDTFKNSVFDSSSSVDYLTKEAVLHIPTYSNVEHSEGTVTMNIIGLLDRPYGNNVNTNNIKSACVVAGTTPNVGGPGEGNYIMSGAEKLFSRIFIGSLVKTSEKAFSLQWTFKIN